ncbi:hypothetical protein ABPG74_013724 [Tetrahymena malaccensis]
MEVQFQSKKKQFDKVEYNFEDNNSIEDPKTKIYKFYDEYLQKDTSQLFLFQDINDINLDEDKINHNIVFLIGTSPSWNCKSIYTNLGYCLSKKSIKIGDLQFVQGEVKQSEIQLKSYKKLQNFTLRIIKRINANCQNDTNKKGNFIMCHFLSKTFQNPKIWIECQKQVEQESSNKLNDKLLNRSDNQSIQKDFDEQKNTESNQKKREKYTHELLVNKNNEFTQKQSIPQVFDPKKNGENKYFEIKGNEIYSNKKEMSIAQQNKQNVQKSDSNILLQKNINEYYKNENTLLKSYQNQQLIQKNLQKQIQLFNKNDQNQQESLHKNNSLKQQQQIISIQEESDNEEQNFQKQASIQQQKPIQQPKSNNLPQQQLSQDNTQKQKSQVEILIDGDFQSQEREIIEIEQQLNPLEKNQNKQKHSIKINNTINQNEKELEKQIEQCQIELNVLENNTQKAQFNLYQIEADFCKIMSDLKKTRNKILKRKNPFIEDQINQNNKQNIKLEEGSISQNQSNQISKQHYHSKIKKNQISSYDSIMDEESDSQIKQDQSDQEEYQKLVQMKNLFNNKQILAEYERNDLEQQLYDQQSKLKKLQNKLILEKYPEIMQGDEPMILE